MKIGQLAAQAGMNASAIRYYETLRLLAPPHRSSGQRRYPDETLNRVLLIRFAREMGFSLSEIKLFLSGLREDAPVGPRWRKLAHRKIAEVEEAIKRARRLKSLLQNLLRCRCASLQICVRCLSLSPNLRLIASRRAAPNAQVRALCPPASCKLLRRRTSVFLSHTGSQHESASKGAPLTTSE